VRWAALALLALALTGCETSADESARIERVAKQHQQTAQQGLSITRQSTKVVLGAASVLHSSEGAAAVLTLRNLSNTTLVGVPIAITLKDAHGSSIYANSAPGLASALVSAPLLRAHSATVWIDDQIQASGVPASVSAKIGEGTPAGGATVALAVTASHLTEEASGGPGLEGTVVNRSAGPQHEVLIDALARRNGRVVAAGRAVLAEVPAHATTRFQLFFIGDPRGARLEVQAPVARPG
jgi:hypothetical protein